MVSRVVCSEYMTSQLVVCVIMKTYTSVTDMGYGRTGEIPHHYTELLQEHTWRKYLPTVNYWRMP